jgi:hypothetical protein
VNFPDSDFYSQKISCERLSASPVVVSPVGTETPVYIASQPESVDLDSNDSSLGEKSFFLLFMHFLEYKFCF